MINAVFNPGSVFEVELNAAGQSDRIAATGTATINGGSVTIIPFPDYAVATPYTILTAGGGVSGTFDSVTGTGFVTGQLAYDPNTVFLTLSADADALAAAARTPNQAAVAQSTANAVGNDAVDALAFLPDDASARQAFDALSGEMHASLFSTQIMEQNRLRQIALERSPHVATTLGDGTLWAVGSHTRGEIDGDGNAASIEGRHSGVMVGIEAQLDDAHIGLAIGQSASDLDVDDRNSWAQSTNYHFMAYGGTALGDSGISLDGGASWTWHEVETDRAIAYSGFSGQSSADYEAQTGQVFASLNRTFHIDDTNLRPHIDGAFIHQVNGSFREDGEAGLEADEQSRNIGVTTLGFDAAHAFAIDETNELTLSGGIGWQHVIGDAESDRRVAFRDAPATARTVKGVSLARDALSVNSAIEYTVGDSVNFSLRYDALLAADSSQQGIGGQIGIRF